MADGPSVQESLSSTEPGVPRERHKRPEGTDNIKIASAVVLVERSEIAESRKKLRVSNNNNNGGVVGAGRSKDNTKKTLESDESLDADGQQRKTRAEAKKKAQQDVGGGPCAKKRCADRYDSSESSDSGVAVSCGECSSNSSISSSLSSSSTGSDITEPGSPCSTTSSDEGISGVRSTGTDDSAASTGSSSLPSKLAPTQQQPPRPQWPWTPPLATTACSGNGYKRFKAEPEHGTLPRQPGQPDPGPRHGKPGKNHQDSQGKITEYFKTQIKPQQTKTKRNQSSDTSIMVAKNSPEFRRPATVHRNGKNGSGKYNLGNNRSDWEIRSLSQGLNGIQQPRLNGKHQHTDKKSTAAAATAAATTTTPTTVANGKDQGLPVLPIPSDVLSTLPSCKISNLRLTSEASPSESPPPTLTSPTSLVNEEANQFKKPILVNENNNLTPNGCSKQSELLSRLILPGTPTESVKDEDDEEDSSRDSAESKQSSLDSLSPILSAPTTIRFPAKVPGKSRGQTADSGLCRWDKCDVSYETSTALLEHLQAAHINTQTGGDNFVCHWQGCKVQGRTSCSRRWLERHVLSHGGNKPFQCIVDGCGNRFSSQTALERHVNGHFNQSETSSTTSRKSTDSGGKLVRRNGKKLRYRRQPWSARIFDYFDSGVMEGLQHRLLELAKTRTQGRLAETPGDSMTLTSQVIARRVELDGKTRVLLRWYPQEIEPDEWVLESEMMFTKHVSIRSVASTRPEEVHVALYPAVNGGKPPLQRVKQRRKPTKNT